MMCVIFRSVGTRKLNAMRGFENKIDAYYCILESKCIKIDGYFP